MDVLELDGPVLAASQAEAATRTLETGGVVLFPTLPFTLGEEEDRFLDPAILARAKNVSLDPASGRLSGAKVEGRDLADLSAMLARFSACADALLAAVAPGYVGALQKRRTSFRPGAVSQRVLSARKDDRRLHMDAFPTSPVQGRRILRVFANVNPAGEARVWEVGEDGFEAFARRSPLRATLPRAKAWWLERLGLTRGPRTPYDQLMLELHDGAKLDGAYQAQAAKRRLELPAGSMWIVYTDSVLHAALQGQHALEQTYLLPVDAMQDSAQAPLRILERLTGRTLA